MVKTMILKRKPNRSRKQFVSVALQEEKIWPSCTDRCGSVVSDRQSCADGDLQKWWMAALCSAEAPS